MTVQILKVGHALVQGVRGEKGGAPSKDSIWGVAKVGTKVVKFFGRNGGKLRFKTERDTEACLAMFQKKVKGEGMSYHYTDVTSKLHDNAELQKKISVEFRHAKRDGKVNARSLEKKAKKA